MQKVVAITINHPVEELYGFWRDFTNLPQLIDHVDLVTVEGDYVHWNMRLSDDQDISWVTTITDDLPNKKIAWHSLDETPIKHTGAVTFSPAPANKGVEVRLSLTFDAPDNPLAEALAKLLAPAPRTLAYKALYRFKSLAETGEIPTTYSQPAARGDGRDE